jgi:hypothetical protein
MKRMVLAFPLFAIGLALPACDKLFSRGGAEEAGAPVVVPVIPATTDPTPTATSTAEPSAPVAALRPAVIGKDAGVSDSGKSDAGKSDAGKSDAGKSDAGPSDAGSIAVDAAGIPTPIPRLTIPTAIVIPTKLTMPKTLPTVLPTAWPPK